MKTKLIILLCAVALLTSCEGLDTVPIVSNRDESGRFITPACPKCGAAAKASGTVYLCEKNHVYFTGFLP